MLYNYLKSLLLIVLLALLTSGCAKKAAFVDTKIDPASFYNAATIIKAVQENDLALVAKHLKAKIDVNTQDASLNSLLHLAVLAKNDKMIELLLSHKPNINITNAQGMSPLHLAVQNNNQSATELLLQKEALTEVLNTEGLAAIHTASKNNLQVIVEMLLKKQPADLHLKTKEGLTPLLVAIESGHFHLIKYYLQNKADLNATSNEGLTALELSMRSNSLQTVDFLLKKGANIDQLTSSGQTLLHLASEAGSTKIVLFLVKKGIKVGTKDKKGNLAIDYAVENAHSGIVAFLLSKYSDFSDTYKYQLLTKGLHSKDSKTLLALHQGGVPLDSLEPKTKSSLLHLAVSLDGMEELIKLILEKSSLVIHKDAKGLTPLDYATKEKNENYVQIMRPYYLKTLIAAYIKKDDFLGLKALKKQYPEIMDLITDVKYKLALNGPDELMIGDLKLLSKKGRDVAILIAQVERLKTAYQNFSSDDIGVLVGYGLPSPLIAAILNKNSALEKEAELLKQNKALKSVQDAILKVEEIALKVHQQAAKIHQENLHLTQKLLEKQDEIINEQRATRLAIKSSAAPAGNGGGGNLLNQIGSQIGSKIIEKALD